MKSGEFLFYIFHLQCFISYVISAGSTSRWYILPADKIKTDNRYHKLYNRPHARNIPSLSTSYILKKSLFGTRCSERVIIPCIMLDMIKSILNCQNQKCNELKEQT